MAFEYPNPYPPQEDTIYFELAGNKIAKNKFAENGSAGGYGAGAIFSRADCSRRQVPVDDELHRDRGGSQHVR